MKFNRIQSYYEELCQDVYEQPDEAGRIFISTRIINSCPLTKSIKSVLDVGCGEGYAETLFPNIDYVGITLSKDEVIEGSKKGHNLRFMDYNFLEFEDNSFDLIFSSHSLEHSPFPILTLMEWHRVGKNLLLIMPNPAHYGYIGKNHYSVTQPTQVRWLLRRAGWKVIWKKITLTDLAYLCVKLPRLGSEGWAENPVGNAIYESDRDDTVL